MFLAILKWVVISIVVVTAAFAIYLRTVGHDPAVWHVDPSVSKRTGKPNDYLIAPEGATTAKPDAIAKVHETDPKSLLFQFDAIASPQTEVVGGSVDELWITYAQRTMIMGYPDYITVRAVTAGTGSALIIWSRSRYGHSDFGVNKARIEDWLSKM
ncbi:MAG: DUF1499 domain-containing protein [Pseudomonadota bacterium]